MQQISDHWQSSLMFIFYCFPESMSANTYINLLWLLDSLQEFCGAVLANQDSYLQANVSSELPGGLWTGLGRGVGSNHCPALSLALWASLVGRRGPWVGSLERWPYSRGVLGQLHHYPPGHLLVFFGPYSKPCPSQATCLPWLCLFSLPIPVVWEQWADAMRALSSRETVANGVHCNGVLCWGSSGPGTTGSLLAMGTFPPAIPGCFFFYFINTLSSFSSHYFSLFSSTLLFFPYLFFSPIIKYFSPYFSLLSPFFPISLFYLYCYKF